MEQMIFYYVLTRLRTMTLLIHQLAPQLEFPMLIIPVDKSRDVPVKYRGVSTEFIGTDMDTFT